MLRGLALVLCVIYAEATNHFLEQATRSALTNRANDFCQAINAPGAFACNSNGETFTYTDANGNTLTGAAAIAALNDIRSFDGTTGNNGNTGDRIGCDVDTVTPFLNYLLQAGGVVTGSLEIVDSNNINSANRNNLRACGTYTAEWTRPGHFDKTPFCLKRLTVTLFDVDSNNGVGGSNPNNLNCGVGGFP